MSETVSDDKNEWVKSVLGIDPAGGGPPPSKPSGGIIDDIKYQVGNVENAVGDVWSGIKIKAEAAEQAVEGVVDTVKEKVGDAVEAVEDLAQKATGNAPPTPPKPASITLTSETEANAPADRARLKLGVGERVTLEVKPGPGKWTVSGAKLSSKTGSKVTMTAPVRPGSAEVTVDVGGVTKTLKFTVIAPSSVHQDRVSTEHYAVGFPNAGFMAQIYIGPDDVNFSACTFTEDEIGAKASGYWSAFNGEGHHPNAAALGCTSTVVSGKGTKTQAQDHCYSGYIDDAVLPDWTGQESWTIPWHWQCGSGKGLIGKITQLVVTDKAGSTTISKAGASFTAGLP